MNIIKFFLSIASQKSVSWKTNILSGSFQESEKVLDFGCGDLSFAKSLKRTNPSLQITGVDVSEFRNQPKNIKFVVYDGKRLPFKDGSFDTVVAFYVLHHCPSAKESFKECARVAKKRVLFVESVYRHPIEIPFMRIADWFYNRVKPEVVPLSYQFLSFSDWLNVFSDSGMTLKKSRKIKQVFLPSITPIGISYLFEVTKVK